jgi:hypothetical protein
MEPPKEMEPTARSALGDRASVERIFYGIMQRCRHAEPEY